MCNVWPVCIYRRVFLGDFVQPSSGAPADALRADEEGLSERIGSLNGLFAKAIAELMDADLQAVNGGGGASGGVLGDSR
jgi:hypothetical protein